MEIKLRHNRVMAVIILVCAVFILFVSFLVGPSMNLFIGCLNLFIGIQMLTKPILIITERKAEMKNLFGMTVRTKEFTSPSQLEIENSVLYVNYPGDRQKIARLSKFAYHGPDVDMVHEFVSAQGAKVS